MPLPSPKHLDGLLRRFRDARVVLRVLFEDYSFGEYLAIFFSQTLIYIASLASPQFARLIGVKMSPIGFLVNISHVLAALAVIIHNCLKRVKRVLRGGVCILVARNECRDLYHGRTAELRRKGFEVADPATLERITGEREVCMDIGHLDEAKGSSVDELENVGRGEWAIRVRDALNLVRRIRGELLRWSSGEPVIHMCFEGVPAAFAFALGYAVGIPAHLYVWHKPRARPDMRLAYASSVASDTAAPRGGFSIEVYRCGVRGKSALFIIVTRDDYSNFVKQRGESRELSREVRAYCGVLYDEVVVVKVDAAKGELYDKSVEWVTNVVDGIAAFIRRSGEEYDTVSVMLFGVEAGFAFALGARLDKLLSLQYVLHYSSSARRIAAALPARVLEVYRLREV